MLNTRMIEPDTKYGTIYNNLHKLMDENNLTIGAMSRLSGIKYDVIKKYYYGLNYSVNSEILAKLCYVLNCDVGDILVYESTHIHHKINAS